IEKAEDPGGGAQLPAVDVEQDVAENPAESSERVADQDLDVRALADKIGRDCSSRRGVTLPDLGGDHDDAQLRLAPSRLVTCKKGWPPATVVAQNAQPRQKNC